MTTNGCTLKLVEIIWDPKTRTIYNKLQMKIDIINLKIMCSCTEMDLISDLILQSKWMVRWLLLTNQKRVISLLLNLKPKIKCKSAKWRMSRNLKAWWPSMIELKFGRNTEYHSHHMAQPSSLKKICVWLRKSSDSL